MELLYDMQLCRLGGVCYRMSCNMHQPAGLLGSRWFLQLLLVVSQLLLLLLLHMLMLMPKLQLLTLATAAAAPPGGWLLHTANSAASPGMPAIARTNTLKTWQIRGFSDTIFKFCSRQSFEKKQ